MTDQPATEQQAVDEGWERGGEFAQFSTWVNKAASWIGGTGAKCYDAQGRRCARGADFMRARDEGTFPVRYYFPP